MTGSPGFYQSRRRVDFRLGGLTRIGVVDQEVDPEVVRASQDREAIKLIEAFQSLQGQGTPQDMVLLKRANTGTSISSEEINRIYGKFCQGNNNFVPEDTRPEERVTFKNFRATGRNRDGDRDRMK